jgi:hypothetical protein
MILILHEGRSEQDREQEQEQDSLIRKLLPRHMLPDRVKEGFAEVG